MKKTHVFFRRAMRTATVLTVVFPTAGFAAGPSAQELPNYSSLVYPGPDGRLEYKSYTLKGDRILDFSICGYRRSEVPIPEVPVAVTLSPLPGETVPDGNMAYPKGPDSTARIQGALNEVAARPADENGFRGAVLLKKGTYYVYSTLLVRSGVVLRGEGDDEEGTALIFCTSGGTGIQLGGSQPELFQMSLTGMLTEEKIEDKNTEGFFLTFDDGVRFRVRTPGAGAGFDLGDYKDSKVTITFDAYTQVRDGRKTVQLKDFRAVAIQKVEEGQEVPPRDPALEFSEETDDSPVIRIADSYVPAGSVQLTVEDGSRFKAGDFVVIVKTVNDDWIKDLGMDKLHTIRGRTDVRNWKPGSYQFRHFRQITDVSGNTITLDVMLPQSFAKEHGGGTVQKRIPGFVDSQCGAESLRLVSNYDTTVTGNGKSTDYVNLQSGITVDSEDSWVRNCTVLHVAYAAVSTGDKSRHVTVRDCRALQPVGPITGGKRYTFNIGGGSFNLFYNCYGEDGRHVFVAGSRVMGPHAFVRGSALRAMSTSEPHHRWGCGILFDSISLKEGGSLAALNRGDSGSGHGWSAANTVFWNSDASEVVVFDPPTAENNFAIGYKGGLKKEYPHALLEYGNTRSGYGGRKAGKYKGVPLMGTGFIESPEKPVVPDSLFEQQLIDRIGREKAMQVLEIEKSPEPLFEDDMAADWQEHWFLDGKEAAVEHRDGGLCFSAGTVTKSDDPVEYNAHHAVLWTRQEFDGDIRISFETKEVDNSDYGNVLIYIQAQGIGMPPYENDIYQWRKHREVPAMNKYFDYMSLLSLSLRQELRLKRYPWNDVETGVSFEPLIEPMEPWHGMIKDKWFRFVIEKRLNALTFRSYDAETGELLKECTWDTSSQAEGRTPPFVQKGRIGLRHMSTKQSVYKNFKVEQL